MSNVLQWYPRVALDDCTIDGKFHLSFQEKETKMNSQSTIPSIRSVAFQRDTYLSYVAALRHCPSRPDKIITIVHLLIVLRKFKSSTVYVVMSGYYIKKGWHMNVDATCIHTLRPSIIRGPCAIQPFKIWCNKFSTLHWEFLLFNATTGSPHMSITHKYFMCLQESQKPYTYIPFGEGTRTCLGINMAKATMPVFLHWLTGGYRSCSVISFKFSLLKKSYLFISVGGRLMI